MAVYHISAHIKKGLSSVVDDLRPEKMESLRIIDNFYVIEKTWPTAKCK